jgi:hypothetical protein
MRRILGFSWLATTLLVPLVLLSQTSQTPQTTAPGQSAAVAQTASPAQPAASVQEAAVANLNDDLHIHLSDQFIGQAVQATPRLTCSQKCRDELVTCEHDGQPLSVCDPIYDACIAKC